MRFSLRTLVAFMTAIAVVIGVAMNVGSHMTETYGQTAMWWDELLGYFMG